MLDILFRSQRGRICQYSSGGKAIVTPFVVSDKGDVYVSSEKNGRVFHFFGDEAELDGKISVSESSGLTSEIKTFGKIAVVRLPFGELKIPKESDIVVVPNGFELRNEPRKIIDSVVKLRNAAGHGKLIYFSGLADASNMALLAYMGVDVFDDAVPKACGINGIIQMQEGEVITGNDESEKNKCIFNTECEKIKLFVKGGRLRELVDQRSFSSPSSVALLRLFDQQCYEYQEECCSTVGCRFECNSVQALERPEVLRFRKKILNDYKKPSNKKILLLLPCSAKKPYHLSKTHKRFASAIHTAQHDTLVHEVIVTSPLGAVPRELDVFFPANSYDIPVTGQWKCEEKKFIRELVKHIYDQGYEKVISHLGSDSELIDGLFDYEETVVGDDAASPESLEKLDSVLRASAKNMQPCDYSLDRKETVRSVLSFQFGKEIADAILDSETDCFGKYPFWKIIRGKTQLGMLTADRGMVSLTLEGAEFLFTLGYHIVEMEKFDLTGNLFAVGVKNADESIRIGDEVIVVSEGKVKAVGVAAMCGREMKETSRGIAVKIRHKSK